MKIAAFFVLISGLGLAVCGTAILFKVSFTVALGCMVLNVLGALMVQLGAAILKS